MSPAHRLPVVPHKWRSMRPATRHSLILVVAGHIYMFNGLTYILARGNDTRTEALKVALNIMPMSGWGVLFVITGVLAIVSSRWPPASETWGYTTMTGLSVGWAGFYLAGIPLGSPMSGASGALVWGLLGFLWWGVSGLLNPSGSTATTALNEQPLTPAVLTEQE